MNKLVYWLGFAWGVIRRRLIDGYVDGQKSCWRYARTEYKPMKMWQDTGRAADGADGDNER